MGLIVKTGKIELLWIPPPEAQHYLCLDADAVVDNTATAVQQADDIPTAIDFGHNGSFLSVITRRACYTVMR